MIIDFGKLCGEVGGDSPIFNLFNLFGAAGAGAAGGAVALGGAGSSSFAEGFSTASAATEFQGGAAFTEGFFNLEEMLGFGRGAYAVESGFSRMFESAYNMLHSGAERYIDMLFARDMLGGRPSSEGFDSFWSRMDPAKKKSWEELREVISGHGFILNQLEAAGKSPEGSDAIKTALNEYRALGTTLPDEALLKRAFKALSRVLHPDANKGDDVLMKQLNAAREALGNETWREVYAQELAAHPDRIRSLFQEISQIDWTKQAREAEELFEKGAASAKGAVERLKLNGPVAEETYQGARGWLHELSPAKKAGLVFASILTVGLGAFAIAAWMDPSRNKPKKRASHQDQLTAQAESTKSDDKHCFTCGKF